MTIDGDENLEGLLRAGRVVAEARNEMVDAVTPGVSTGELDSIGRDVFRRHGARSTPRVTYNFPGSTCVSVTDEAAHGIPSPIAFCARAPSSTSMSRLNSMAICRIRASALLLDRFP